MSPRKLWGDYGAPLVSGYAGRDATGGPLLLHRSGPFLPPVSLPWSSLGGHRIVASSEARRQLESLRIEGLRFGLTKKDRIIPIDWHLWDLDAPEPEHFPDNGEPSGYLWDEPNDPAAAMALPEAWECLPTVHGYRIISRGTDEPYEYEYRAEGIGPDLLASTLPLMFKNKDDYGYIVVNEPTRSWMEATFGEWVSFGNLNVH